MPCYSMSCSRCLDRCQLAVVVAVVAVVAAVAAVVVVVVVVATIVVNGPLARFDLRVGGPGPARLDLRVGGPGSTFGSAEH